MAQRRWLSLTALVVVVSLVVAACSGSSEEVVQDPGDGVQVVMARANWSTGYFQAAVVAALVGELGYEVTDPALLEMAPDDYYPGVAAGSIDLWVNSWIPNHNSHLEVAFGDGETIADRVTLIGSVVPGGAFQGFIIDAETADAYDIEYLDDIADNDAIAALFDVDGNGTADLSGCNEGWGCNVLIEELIAANGWQNSITQVVGDFDQLWIENLERRRNGDPVLSYVWAPSAYIAQLVPGQEVLWLSVRSDEGDSMDIALPPSQCPGQPCSLGFDLAEIQAAGNRAFIETNPALEFLLSVIGISITDIALQNLSMTLGENSEDDIRRHADEWIADNRIVVDSWLDAARKVAAA